MSHLSSISGIGKTSLELLEVAGFLDVESLAQAGVEELVTELERANSILSIAKRTPGHAQVQKWVSAAREISGYKERIAPAPVMPVNYEGNPEVATMIDEAPLAVPLSARHFVEYGLAVSDIPPAIFLNRYAGDLEVRIDGLVPVTTQSEEVVETAPQISLPTGRKIAREALSTPSVPVGIDRARLRSTKELTGGFERIPAVTSHVATDRLALLRAPLEKTNRGKNPESRRYIRGVLHTHPVSLWLGAFVTLLLSGVLPTAIVSAALLLLSDQMPEKFSWVPRWLLAFPAALPVLGVCYLIWGQGGGCRICRQRLFWPRNCIKNSKAHHFPGLGYIVPLCLHILLFRWFRCSYCGTPVRLKK